MASTKTPKAPENPEVVWIVDARYDVKVGTAVLVRTTDKMYYFERGIELTGYCVQLPKNEPGRTVHTGSQAEHLARTHAHDLLKERAIAAEEKARTLREQAFHVLHRAVLKNDKLSMDQVALHEVVES